jgi:bifunctional DNA-binding transcriptional regulator/antitoxin component of YhaV-PrlF toxin-antitoxin module
VGIRVGMTESVLDSKGRVLIPEEMRKKARLTTGSKLKLRLEGADTLKITKSIPPKQFIEDLEGVIKKGSPVKKEDPLKLKEIWV